MVRDPGESTLADGRTLPAGTFQTVGRDLGGRFAFRRILGLGGMGLVVAAHDAELDRLVAIKLVGRGGHGPRTRLVREARAMARSSDPHVVAVHEVASLGDRAGIVMQLVDGPDLGAWQASEGRTSGAIIDAYRQAARGLAAVHRAGLVHRDFKPSNALVDERGIVRIADFGLAVEAGRWTAEREPRLPRPAAGTPGFMAPEQLSDGPIDGRADQWALACSLKAALRGRPVDPAEGIGRALRRALASDPAGRFPDMDELIAALSAGPVGGTLGR